MMPTKLEKTKLASLAPFKFKLTAELVIKKIQTNMSKILKKLNDISNYKSISNNRLQYMSPFR